MFKRTLEKEYWNKLIRWLLHVLLQVIKFENSSSMYDIVRLMRLTIDVTSQEIDLRVFCIISHSVSVKLTPRGLIYWYFWEIWANEREDTRWNAVDWSRVTNQNRNSAVPQLQVERSIGQIANFISNCQCSFSINFQQKLKFVENNSSEIN